MLSILNAICGIILVYGSYKVIVNSLYFKKNNNVNKDINIENHIISTNKKVA